MTPVRSFCPSDPSHVLAQRAPGPASGRCTLVDTGGGTALVCVTLAVPLRQSRAWQRWCADILAVTEACDEGREHGGDVLRLMLVLPVCEAVEPSPARALVPVLDTRGAVVWRVHGADGEPLLSIHGADPREAWPSLASSAAPPLAA